ncbi:MAG TPA: hypothetical protein VLO30_01910 [Chthoniobacterales bacterium]|nr:hypothetical protein [Chthoniobacterales bacterium]
MKARLLVALAALLAGDVFGADENPTGIRLVKEPSSDAVTLTVSEPIHLRIQDHSRSDSRKHDVVEKLPFTIEAAGRTSFWAAMS